MLYAEDEPDDIFFLERAFERAGIANPLQAVSHGQSAIDYLSGAGHFASRELHPFPCLVVLDINMPMQSGLEVLEWIRRRPHLKSLPVVMLTSSSRHEDIEKARELGSDDYLLKPSNPMDLVEIAKSLHHRWLSQPTLLESGKAAQRLS